MHKLSDSEIEQIIRDLSLTEILILLKKLFSAVNQGQEIPSCCIGFILDVLKERADDNRSN